MAVDDRGTVVLPREGKTISLSDTFSSNGMRFVYIEPEENAVEPRTRC